MASIDVLVKEKLPPLEVPQKECPQASPAEEGPLAPGRRQGPELSPATMSRTVSWSVRRRPNAEGRRSNEGCHFCPPVCCVRLLGRKITRPAGPERLCPRSPRDSDVQRQVRLLCWFRAIKIIYLSKNLFVGPNRNEAPPFCSEGDDAEDSDGDKKKRGFCCFQ